VKLNPYPAYKDSGLPWLGKIPAHWEMRRNGRLFTQRIETGFPDLPILEVSLRTGVSVRDLDDTKRKQLMSNREQYKRAARGDIAYNMMRMWQGAVGMVPTDGLVSPAYVVARPFPEIESRYYSYLFRTAAYMNEVNKYSRGIVTDRNRLYWDEFKQMPAVFPPAGEQRAIAEFLDSHGRTVRHLIGAKRRLIELLNEQKQTIINRAVTCGLDPTIRLKPSGIDWLRDIPEHWEATQLKYVAEVQTGVTLGKTYGAAVLEPRPYLRVANVQDGYLDLQDITTIHVPVSEAASCELQAGDVLMTEGGDIDKLGRGYIWQGEIPGCLHQNHIFAVRAERSMLLPEYLALLMTSIHGRSYFQLSAKQTTNLASTNSTTLKAFPLFLPSIDEQQRVLDYIAKETASLNSAISRALGEIDLIREYRICLITDVVTGKLDVRGMELPALDEATELDDSNGSEDVAELAEELGEVEAIEEENGN
jgi:type I restriction enzyme S subunit